MINKLEALDIPDGYLPILGTWNQIVLVRGIDDQAVNWFHMKSQSPQGQA